MGRYSSDSEEERKKRKKKKKKRSRSRSKSGSIDSRHSTKQKKSKKSKKKYRSRSGSRSSDRYKRSRSSRSRSSSRNRRSKSYDRYRTKSRSRSRDRYRRRSRSLSRDRYSRSRSRERRRRRSRSYERSSRRSRSYSPSKKDKKRETSAEREDPCSSIPGFANMTPAEQARIRMHMALKAAAAADEKLKGEVPRSQSSISLQESMQFSQAVQDIESGGFASAAFKSSRGDKKDEPVSVKEEFLFGTAAELKLDPSQRKPVIVNVETDELAHQSLYADPEEKMDRWIQKLSAMRRKKLEGEALI